MLIHVRMPHLDADVRISGKGAEEILKGLKTLFEVEVEELELITESDWFKEIREDWTNRTTIRVQRQKRGWTQVELAGKLSVSKQVISDLENDRRPISLDRAKKLGDVFNMDFRKFL